MGLSVVWIILCLACAAAVGLPLGVMVRDTSSTIQSPAGGRGRRVGAILLGGENPHVRSARLDGWTVGESGGTLSDRPPYQTPEERKAFEKGWLESLANQRRWQPVELASDTTDRALRRQSPM